MRIQESRCLKLSTCLCSFLNKWCYSQLLPTFIRRQVLGIVFTIQAFTSWEKSHSYHSLKIRQKSFVLLFPVKLIKAGFAWSIWYQLNVAALLPKLFSYMVISTVSRIFFCTIILLTIASEEENSETFCYIK